jgi:signal transduction histidine kinase
VLHGPLQDFFQRQRTALWPQAPYMFAGVPLSRALAPGFPAGVPGTTVTFDVRGTIDLALRLQPQAKRLIVVAGSAEYDRDQVNYVRPILERYRDRLTVEYVLEQSIEKTSQLLAALPRNAIVLSLPMFRDARGRVFDPGEVLRRLASVSNAPIYSFYDTSLGSGVVGGSMENWAGQRTMLGKIARELLLGGPRIESLRMHPPGPTLCNVDWRQLARWHLPEANVPEGCVVNFREASFLDRHRKQAIAIGAVVLAQIGLVVALLAQRRRRRVAELEADRQRSQLSHASRLAMVGEMSASIAHEIGQPLAAILWNAEAGESLLESGQPCEPELREILTAIRHDDERVSDIVQRLRRFLRKEQGSMRLLDLNDVVAGILRLVSALVRRNGVLLTTELRKETPTVKGDSVQIQQVVVNLILNAMEAMNGLPGERRRMKVTTTADPEGNAEISVMDLGSGSAPDKLSRIFEPFYSTKPDGMGLGLSISHTIARAHCGRIWAESGTSGATFRFRIPAST